MKQIIPLLLLIAIPFLTIAQKKITIAEKNLVMSKGDQPGFILEIPQADFDEAKNEWSKLIRQNTKSKVETRDNEISVAGTQIPEIYGHPFNIYSILLKTDSAVKVAAFFEIDSSFFAYNDNNKNLDKENTYFGIKSFLKNFGLDQYKYAVNIELQDAEKKLKDLNKEFKDLAKENEKFHKEIKVNEQNIKNTEDAIATNQNENARITAEINQKNETIRTLSNEPDLKDQAKDQLKDLQKEKRNVENSLEKDQKKIVGYQSNIKELNLEIEKNEKKQENKKAEIDQQEIVVKRVVTKLSEIE